MAGVDFPSEERELREARRARAAGPSGSLVGNDTFAVLRAGHRARLGRGGHLRRRDQLRRRRAGRAARALPGARGDHRRLGRRLRRRLAALFAAARSEDGRGPQTALERAVPAHFGLATPRRAGRGDPPRADPAAARDRAPAGRLRGGRATTRSRPRSSTASRARSSRWRGSRSSGSSSTDEPAEVLLGGGLLQAGDGRLLAAIEAELRGSRRASCVTTPSSPPIVGAALLGLDEIGAVRRGAAPGARASSRPRSRRREEPMADVRFEQATRVYAGHDAPAVRRARPAHRGRRVHGARRPVGLRQDDGAADARRPRGGRRRRRLHRRPRRHRTCRRRSATSRWCSRTTRSTRT